ERSKAHRTAARASPARRCAGSEPRARTSPPRRQRRPPPPARHQQPPHAATTPASAYKTPVLVGKRSTLAYPLAAAAINKMRLRTKIRIDIRPSTPTFYRNLTGSAAYLGRASSPESRFNEVNRARQKSPNR